MHYLIGIDEAGRGPWAGPVVAGGFLVRSDLFPEVFQSLVGITDSKKISEKKRVEFFSVIERLQFHSECQFAFSYRDAQVIDDIGIREANRQSMQDVLLSLLQFVGPLDTVQVWIDGCDNYQFDIENVGYRFAKKSNSKKALEESMLSSQVEITYVIHGDSVIPVISGASIIAKVLRDRMMCEFDEEFPGYGFSGHKGYGTRKHAQSLLNYGITPIHRKSYAPVKALISPHTSI